MYKQKYEKSTFKVPFIFGLAEHVHTMIMLRCGKLFWIFNLVKNAFCSSKYAIIVTNVFRSKNIC